ncbi:MAG: hypothetical protein HY885_07670 [Deltaproteobacteria bacterium]|nr:hypothetical protein [Deltaproteobacteria bacterium]
MGYDILACCLWHISLIHPVFRPACRILENRESACNTRPWVSFREERQIDQGSNEKKARKEAKTGQIYFLNQKSGGGIGGGFSSVKSLFAGNSAHHAPQNQAFQPLKTKCGCLGSRNPVTFRYTYR